MIDALKYAAELVKWTAIIILFGWQLHEHGVSTDNRAAEWNWIKALNEKVPPFTTMPNSGYYCAIHPDDCIIKTPLPGGINPDVTSH